MTWNYRVVRTTHGQEEAFAIYEVYYDAHGRPEARTEAPVSPAGETLAELAEDLRHYEAALRLPILESESLQALGLFDGEAVPFEVRHSDGTVSRGWQRLMEADSERQAQLDALAQSNAELAETTRMLEATRRDIEAQWRERQQAAGGPPG